MVTKIVVATHKDYNIPKEDLFLPVFVGSALSKADLPFQRDDEGDNISDRNRTFCELTGLYWAYKNLKADKIGLCHYRRYFDLKNIDLEKENIILPKKRHYYIETVYDQFGHAHGYKGLDTVRQVIASECPDYLESFDICMMRRGLHIYNMFIMKYELFIKYCDFLFPILFKAEEKLGETDRLYGYLAERLLDVFLEKNNYSFIETKVIETEKTDWIRKIGMFLKRKYFGGQG